MAIELLLVLRPLQYGWNYGRQMGLTVLMFSELLQTLLGFCLAVFGKKLVGCVAEIVARVTAYLIETRVKMVSAAVGSHLVQIKIVLN